MKQNEKNCICFEKWAWPFPDTSQWLLKRKGFSIRHLHSHINEQSANRRGHTGPGNGYQVEGIKSVSRFFFSESLARNSVKSIYDLDEILLVFVFLKDNLGFLGSALRSVACQVTPLDIKGVWESSCRTLVHTWTLVSPPRLLPIRVLVLLSGFPSHKCVPHKTFQLYEIGTPSQGQSSRRQPSHYRSMLWWFERK